MQCVFKEIEGPDADGKRRLVCENCQREVRVRSTADQTFARCKNSAEPVAELPPMRAVLGWGDRLERLLSAVGITKERVAWLFGPKMSDCGCGARQEALNGFGDRVKIYTRAKWHRFRLNLSALLWKLGQ